MVKNLYHFLIQHSSNVSCVLYDVQFEYTWCTVMEFLGLYCKLWKVIKMSLGRKLCQKLMYFTVFFTVHVLFSLFWS